jgi:hypothetical protein
MEFAIDQKIGSSHLAAQEHVLIANDAEEAIAALQQLTFSCFVILLAHGFEPEKIQVGFNKLNNTNALVVNAVPDLAGGPCSPE